MSVHITCTWDSGVRVLHLEGWLEGDNVGELERVARGAAEPLRLDLTGLRSTDTAGLEALRALRAQGAVLVGASPYLRLLLAP